MNVRLPLKLRVPWNYPLFKHMAEEHDKYLTDSELDEIIRIVKTLTKPKSLLPKKKRKV